MPFACFSCLNPAEPEGEGLSRAQLKALFDKSVSANNGRLIVHGIFARADTRNNNKRIYQKHILKREVAKFDAEHIQQGTALGELDHPNYASKYFKCLNLPNVSHQVLEVSWKGDQLWGSIEILPTPSGLLLRELYAQGIKLGVSSRGWASLHTDDKHKCVYVDKDFELITFDFVTEPSTRGAYLVPIRKAYKAHVPDQKKSIQVAHLGHGVCSLEHVPKLPDVAVLVARINELQAQLGRSNGGGAPEWGIPSTDSDATACSQSQLAHLDKLLMYSHYIVFQDAAYLDREQDARDYSAHLAMFATRAHLSHQQQYNRADLNLMIMQEIAKEEATDVPSQQPMRQSASIANMQSREVPSDKQRQYQMDAECQGQPAADLLSDPSWALHQSSSSGRGSGSGDRVLGGKGYDPPPRQQQQQQAGRQQGQTGKGSGGRGGGGDYDAEYGHQPASQRRQPVTLPESHAPSRHGSASTGDYMDRGDGASSSSCGRSGSAGGGGGGAGSGHSSSGGRTDFGRSGGSAELLYGHGLKAGAAVPLAVMGRVGGHASGSGRVHPYPLAGPGAAAQQRPGLGGPGKQSGPPPDVVLEFVRIKATLASYAGKYQQRQRELQEALQLDLPLVSAHMSIGGARARC